MRTRILRPVLALTFLALTFLLPLSAAAMQAQWPDTLAARVDGAHRVGAFSLSRADIQALFDQAVGLHLSLKKAKSSSCPPIRCPLM